MLRARMRASSGWTDACILNVSSRGLLINASTAAAIRGNTIELWHGEHLIVADVMWRKGTRAGLRAEDRIAVDDIMAVGQVPSLQLTGAQWPWAERRRRPRTHDDSRLRGRAIEFAGIAVIATLLAAAALVMMEQAFAKPMAYVKSALGD